MIRPDDIQYHHNKDSHWQWAETLFFPVNIPGTTISGGLYVLTRPVLGVAMCSVTFMDRLGHLWEEQAYIDNQQHLPCPETMADFTLPNGFSHKAIEPLKHHHVIYEGIDDTRCDIEFFGLHEPYDCHDPAMDPLAAKRMGSSTWDKAFAGHYELTYHMKGELTLRGKRYEIDSVDTGDRSWGPRVERDNGAFVWWHASFGKDLTVHVMTQHELHKSNRLGEIISGYVLDKGKIYGLVACEGQQEYNKAVPMSGQLEVVDERGERFAFTYSALNSCYMAPYPSNTFVQTFMRVNHNGRIGYGTQQAGISRAYATRHREAILARY